MLYDLLLQGTVELARGLLEDRYRRWGGVIRVAAGHPGAGQIVGMLRDASAIGKMALNASPLGLAMQAVDVVASAHGHIKTHRLIEEGFAQTHSLLRADLALSTVAAAASVVNLGVSVVGFTLMNRKLVRLQESMGVLHGGLSRLELEARDTRDSLLELRVVAAAHGERLQEILADVRTLGLDLLSDKLGAVRATLDALESESLDAAVARANVFELRRVRYSLEAQLQGRSIDIGPHLIDALLRLRVWALAAGAEVLALRKLGQVQDAAHVAADVAQMARGLGTSWSRSLLPPAELGGVGRFGNTAFTPHLTTNQRRRLFTLQAGHDVSAADMRVGLVDGAMQVVQRRPVLPPGWVELQVALAQTFDSVEEIVERLEALAMQSEFCRREGLDFSQFEGIAPAADSIYECDSPATATGEDHE